MASKVIRDIDRSVNLIHRVLFRLDRNGKGVRRERFIQALDEAIRQEKQGDPDFVFYLGANRSLKNCLDGQQQAGQIFIWQNKRGRVMLALAEPLRRSLASV